MRTKLFILLALFVAFSATSFAQTTATNTINVDLQENRTLEFGTGLSAFDTDITRLSNTQLADTTNWTSEVATLTVDHDLGIDQKITVKAAITVGDWVGRYLSVTPTSPVGVAAGETTLINDGAVGAVADLVTAIPSTAGVPQEVTLNYLIAAGPNASPGIHTTEIYYTLLDN